MLRRTNRIQETVVQPSVSQSEAVKKSKFEKNKVV